MEENDALSLFDAEEDWKRTRRKVLYQEVVCFFKQCSVDLLSFEEVRSGLKYEAVLDVLMTSPQPFCRVKDICDNAGSGLMWP